jgi:hypothetical protein
LGEASISFLVPVRDFSHVGVRFAEFELGVVVVAVVEMEMDLVLILALYRVRNEAVQSLLEWDGTCDYVYLIRSYS